MYLRSLPSDSWLWIKFWSYWERFLLPSTIRNRLQYAHDHMNRHAKWRLIRCYWYYYIGCEVPNGWPLRSPHFTSFVFSLYDNIKYLLIKRNRRWETNCCSCRVLFGGFCFSSSKNEHRQCKKLFWAAVTTCY